MDSKMAKRNRQKGQEGEREVCKYINAAMEFAGVTGVRAKRILTESRTGSFDVEIRQKTRPGRSRRLPFVIQVKNVSTQWGSYLLKSWREARLVSDFPRETPIGVVKVPTKASAYKRDQWLVVMPLEWFAASLGVLLREGQKQREVKKK